LPPEITNFVSSVSAPNLKKVSYAGLLIALGIVYGDIGTSPLYAFDAITRGKLISDLLILGGVSCIIWTLTLQTTVKYVMITLRADNNGEGGIFSLYALIRRHAKWTVFFAMIGGASLLADGLITPPITVTSAIEGLNLPHDATLTTFNFFFFQCLAIIERFLFYRLFSLHIFQNKNYHPPLISHAPLSGILHPVGVLN
jgi:KUP system potassium uptake protein